jgi:hypothetical protein
MPDKELEATMSFTDDARQKVNWNKRLYVFADIIPKSHLVDLHNYFGSEDYALIETIRDAFLDRLLNTFLNSTLVRKIRD